MANEYTREDIVQLAVGNPFDNADLSQEYTYIDRYGVGVAMTGKIGIYTFS